MIGEDAKIVGKSPLDFVSWKDDLSLTLENTTSTPKVFRLFGLDAGNTGAIQGSNSFPEYELSSVNNIGVLSNPFHDVTVTSSDNYTYYKTATAGTFKIVQIDNASPNIDVSIPIPNTPNLVCLSISESLDEVYACVNDILGNHFFSVFDRFTGAFKYTLSTTDSGSYCKVDEVRKTAYVFQSNTSGTPTTNVTVQVIDLVGMSISATSILTPPEVLISTFNYQYVVTDDFIYTSYYFDNFPTSTYSISKFSKISNTEVSYISTPNAIGGFAQATLTHCPSNNCIIGCVKGEVYKYDLSTDTFIGTLPIPSPLNLTTLTVSSYNGGDKVVLSRNEFATGTNFVKRLDVNSFTFDTDAPSSSIPNVNMINVYPDLNIAYISDQATALGIMEVMNLDTGLITGTTIYTHANSRARILSNTGDLKVFNITTNVVDNFIESSIDISPIINTTASIEQINEEFKYNPIKVGCIKFESSSREQLTSKMEYKYSNATGKEQSSNIQLINYVPAMRTLNVGFVKNLDFVFDGQNALEVTVQPNSRLFLSFYYRETKFAFIQGNIEGGYMNNDEI